jgi:hypothetical protein
MTDNSMSFVDLAKDYARYSTDAPTNYAEVTAVQVLGHCLGHDVIHRIQPHAIYHNFYVLLIGDSTLSRKTTTQMLFKQILPKRLWLPNEGSPEAFLEILSNQNDGFQWMGEFSKLLKGIKQGSYTSTFAEFYNDLYDCQSFERKLRSKKDDVNEFHIEKPYISVNSTITPVVLKQFFNREMAEGGLAPRFLMVGCDKPCPRPRKWLRSDIVQVRDILKNQVKFTLGLKREGVFALSDDAMVYYNGTIEKEAYEFKRCGAFAGRYLDYVIKVADVLVVSDALGIATEDGHMDKLVELVDLVKLVELVDSTSEYSKTINSSSIFSNRTKGFKATNSTNSTNVMFAQKDHLERAWKIVKPCLETASELVTYVDMGKELAKAREYIKKFNGGKVYHSDVLRMTNMTAKTLSEVADTLIDREDIVRNYDTYYRKGSHIQCHRTWYKWVGGSEK